MATETIKVTGEAADGGEKGRCGSCEYYESGELGSTVCENEKVRKRVNETAKDGEFRYGCSWDSRGKNQGDGIIELCVKPDFGCIFWEKKGAVGDGDADDKKK